MSVRVSETETKYEVPDGTGMPPLDELPFGQLTGVSAVSEPDEKLLDAEYYDTDDLRLIRSGITLRRRTGGSDDGWHLKLPDGADTRQEIRLPPGQRGVPPAELAGLVRAYVRGAELRPVARMATRRQTVVLLDGAGEPLAEVASDDVHAEALGDSAAVSRWHEVEVELTGGDRPLLRSAGELLRRQGLVQADRAAKLERALGDRLPRPAEPPRLTPQSPAGEVVLAYLRKQAKAIMTLDPAVRSDQPDSVHQMRVAARRARSALRSFGSVLDRADTEHLSGELRWLGVVLGDARDAEVLAGHLKQSLRAVPVEQLIGPVQARVQRHFASVRTRARAAVLAGLDAQRYLSLLDAIDQLLADPPLRSRAADPAAEVLPGEVGRACRQVGRRIRRARHAPAGQPLDVALHQARKSAKRARYAAEAVSSAFGTPAAGFASRMKKLQSVLGEHQDAVITRQVIRELGVKANLAGENAFTFGLLFERENSRAERAAAKARKVWRRASRPCYGRWLS